MPWRCPVRKRQHVNVNALCFETFSGEMPRLEPGRVVELEIGCADAQFLFERAAKDPTRTYIGLEIREALVDDVNKRAKAQGLPVQAVWVHASLHLASIMPMHSVRHCYLNFPDPWFKRKHRDRRMINESLLRQLHPVMEPEGDVLMQSDVFDVALDAMHVFESCDDMYENLVDPWTFWKEGNPFAVRSWREMNCEDESMPVWRMRYKPLTER
jgi:tRNA (guanine-N7-)-methyltransferase